MVRFRFTESLSKQRVKSTREGYLMPTSALCVCVCVCVCTRMGMHMQREGVILIDGCLVQSLSERLSLADTHSHTLGRKRAQI